MKPQIGDRIKFEQDGLHGIGHVLGYSKSAFGDSGGWMVHVDRVTRGYENSLHNLRGSNFDYSAKRGWFVEDRNILDVAEGAHRQEALQSLAAEYIAITNLPPMESQ